MTGRDEERSFAILASFLSTCAAPLLDTHEAGVRKQLGDGLLATFDSADAAVSCAEAMQAEVMRDRQSDAPRWKPLSLRIAVHLADVRFLPDDVMGDGVNLAKRLQEAGAPDSVIVSHSVCEALSVSRAGSLHDLGFVSLKGFATPVRAYDLGVRAAGSIQTGDIPSIAILPFESLGAQAEDRYFADGLVEDIIVSLSGLREMVVISRNATLTFRDRQLDPRDARRILGVRYVLQGTVRRRGGAIRLSATLSDTKTGATMFSTQSDLNDLALFEEQDRLVYEIVANVAPQVRRAELANVIRKPPEIFSAYDQLLRALEHMRHLDRESYNKARQCLDAAIADDPRFAAAYAWKANWIIVMVAQGWLADRARAAEEAEEAARRAVELDDQNALALAILGHVKAFLRGDHEAALSLLERARRIGPSNAMVLMMSAGGLAYVGRGEEAVMFAEKAHHHVPLDHIPFREFDWLSLANYAAGKYRAAAFWARRALDEEAAHMPSLRLLAASRAASDDAEGAASAADRLLACDPHFRVRSYAQAYQTFADPTLQQRWIDHLIASGLPE
jgi:adenylate cyclase